jgi:hypothetical protein
MARQISWRGVLSPDTAGGRVEALTWEPRTPLVPPRSITDAVRLMQFGAVLEVLEIARGFLTRGGLRSAVVAEATNSQLSTHQSDIDTVVVVSLTVTTVIAVVGCVLWLLLARATARGSRWGRFIASGLYALALFGFFGGLLPTGGALARTFALALLQVGGWALVRLWHRDSSAFIRYQSIPRD